MRGMQVRMRALLQVVVAWVCGGDGASARTAAEALGGHGSPGLMCVAARQDRCLRDLRGSLQLRTPIFLFLDHQRARYPRNSYFFISFVEVRGPSHGTKPLAAAIPR